MTTRKSSRKRKTISNEEFLDEDALEEYFRRDTDFEEEFIEDPNDGEFMLPAKKRKMDKQLEVEEFKKKTTRKLHFEELGQHVGRHGRKMRLLGPSFIWQNKIFHFGGMHFHFRWAYKRKYGDGLNGFDFVHKRQNNVVVGVEGERYGSMEAKRSQCSSIRCNNIAVVFGGWGRNRANPATEFIDLETMREVKMDVLNQPDPLTKNHGAVTVSHGDVDLGCVGALQLYCIESRLWKLECLERGKWKWIKIRTLGVKPEPGEDGYTSLHLWHDFKDRVLLIGEKVYELNRDDSDWKWEVFLDRKCHHVAGVVHHHLIVPADGLWINLRTKETCQIEELRTRFVLDSGYAVTDHSLITLGDKVCREIRVPNLPAGGWFDMQRNVWWSPTMVMVASLLLWIDFTVTDDPEEDECQWKFLPLEVMERIFSFMIAMEPQRMTLPEDPWASVSEEEWKDLKRYNQCRATYFKNRALNLHKPVEKKPSSYWRQLYYDREGYGNDRGYGNRYWW